MGYLGYKPADKPLTAADITDGIITTAKIADGNITSTKILDGTILNADINASAAIVSTKLSGVQGKFESALLHVRDEKASGTAGGSATSGSYQTRTLNTSVTNEISGASLSSNQITLPTGTYFVNGFVSSFYVDKHKSKLRNTTDSTDTLIGQVVRSDSSFYSGGASIIIGRFTIASTKVFEIQTRVQTTRNTDGYGEAPGFGDAEVYIDVQIWKVA